MSNASDPLQYNRKAFLIYIIMEIQELKDKKKQLEFNIYNLILDFIQETEVSDIDLRLITDRVAGIGSGEIRIVNLEVKIQLGI